MSALLKLGRVEIALATLVFALVLATGLVRFGPGRAWVDEARAQKDREEARVQEWLRAKQVASRFDAKLRNEWSEHWESVQRRVPVLSNDVDLLAVLGGQIDGSQLSNFEIRVAEERVAFRRDEEEEETALVHEPLGEHEYRIVHTPVQVSFSGDYARVLELLDLLETGESGARIEAVELRRDGNGVRGRIDLDAYSFRTVADPSEEPVG